MAHSAPDAIVEVYERNHESDVFGFGVVFSDATLDNIDRVDPVLRDTLADHGRHWDSIEVHAKGEVTAAGGNGMSAVHRRVLLGALRHRALELGAKLHYSTTASVQSLDEDGGYDLIVAADGTNSASRDSFAADLDHSVEEATVKFIWFGTTFQFDGLTFLHKQSEHGNFAVHAYPIGSDLSTFIVETDEDTWRKAGLDGFDMSSPPGESDAISQRYLEDLFADRIDGAKLVANNSRWANFKTRRTGRWHSRTERGTPVVFLGDAMHTAHFSVG
ncbi:MAG: 2-polyprenyl-6-methoxyphenol hydroxylase, partial [Rhodococcus sp. (in: high G+C Gram-positive bacteria)]|nr:2-polyprenyl-6-methoxyphenol hydroxylase [Rhodococcus sp. (in: high G+C Gram-positive bacteria)]